MSKCVKSKNPCKICLGTVTQKTGLQCEGACESWVHYSCLNYTPGRIKDIKLGVIKVTCPCPDCHTSKPKEYRTDEVFSCTNVKCPANNPPSCEVDECPSHPPKNNGDKDKKDKKGKKGKKGEKNGEKMNQTSEILPPLSKCGEACKQHSSPNMKKQQGEGLSPPSQPPNTAHLTSSSDSCLPCNKCRGVLSSNGGLTENFPGDTKMQQPGATQQPDGLSSSNILAMQELCKTVGLLSNQINELMNKMQKVTPGNQGNKRV